MGHSADDAVHKIPHKMKFKILYRIRYKKIDVTLVQCSFKSICLPFCPCRKECYANTALTSFDVQDV